MGRERAGFARADELGYHEAAQSEDLGEFFHEGMLRERFTASGTYNLRGWWSRFDRPT